MADHSARDVRTILLAGGKGTRLRPFTTVFPKPLVPLGHKPVIEILLRQLSHSNLKKVTISTGYLAELVMALCGDGEKFGVAIDYVRENEPLGTAGPVGLIEDLAGDVIVMNGDLLTTISFPTMIEYHKARNADVTIAIHRREVRIDFGVVETGSDGAFQGFQEKPVFNYDVSMGVNVLSEHARSFIAKERYLNMPDLILEVHKAGGKVCCYREDCYWLDIGRMDDYAQAQADFVENEDLFMGQ